MGGAAPPEHSEGRLQTRADAFIVAPRHVGQYVGTKNQILKVAPFKNNTRLLIRAALAMLLPTVLIQVLLFQISAPICEAGAS